jgi:hypothetical protein
MDRRRYRTVETALGRRPDRGSHRDAPWRPVALGGARQGFSAAARAGAKDQSRREIRCGRAPPSKPKKKLAPRGKSLFDLTNNCCRWPYRRPGAERYFFCGDPSADLEAGRPYCPEHMRRAYLVQPPLVVSPRRKTPRAA